MLDLAVEVGLILFGSIFSLTAFRNVAALACGKPVPHLIHMGDTPGQPFRRQGLVSIGLLLTGMLLLFWGVSGLLG